MLCRTFLCSISKVHFQTIPFVIVSEINKYIYTYIYSAVIWWIFWGYLETHCSILKNSRSIYERIFVDRNIQKYLLAYDPIFQNYVNDIRN